MVIDIHVSLYIDHRLSIPSYLLKQSTKGAMLRPYGTFVPRAPQWTLPCNQQVGPCVRRKSLSHIVLVAPVCSTQMKGTPSAFGPELAYRLRVAQPTLMDVTRYF